MPPELLDLSPHGARPAAAVLRRRLLDWYRAGARDLPWRRSRDPYRVWVSEVMLQQTTVAAVTPYYARFLERFPNLEALARARPADVLAAWAGLGYYRRARALHDAARIVVREHEGQVPAETETFAALPGVGRYTTGAVLSICFDRPLAALDGNVARVLSRLYALDVTIRNSRGAARLWDLASSLVPMRRPGEWNQALMELGATICTPRTPKCEECPVRAQCRAFALGRMHELPPFPKRRARVRLRRAVALIERRGRVLMIRREGRLLAGLWEPPGVDLERGEEAAPSLRRALSRLGVRARLEAIDAEVRHVITHRTIDVEVWRGSVEDRPRERNLRWIDPAGTRDALTALASRLVRTKDRGASGKAGKGPR
jgi:A/G-specific adenine glycosylase